jgi:RNA polymerase primary sigma factor
MKLPSYERRKLLTASEERSLLKQASEGDIRARESLVLYNQGLVLKMAHKYSNAWGNGLTFDDLVQEGNVGLLKAIDRFKLNKNTRFSTYAVWWIRQRIGRASFEKGHLLRVASHFTETFNRASRLKREKKELSAKEKKVLEQGLPRQTTWEDKAFKTAFKTFPDILFLELEAIKNFIEKQEDIPEIEKKILLLRLGLEEAPVSFEEIGIRLGISLWTAGNKYARCIKKLKKTWSKRYKTV